MSWILEILIKFSLEYGPSSQTLREGKTKVGELKTFRTLRCQSGRSFIE
jgi:hypothetical protein